MLNIQKTAVRATLKSDVFFQYLLEEKSIMKRGTKEQKMNLISKTLCAETAIVPVVHD